MKFNGFLVARAGAAAAQVATGWRFLRQCIIGAGAGSVSSVVWGDPGPQALGVCTYTRRFAEKFFMVKSPHEGE